MTKNASINTAIAVLAVGVGVITSLRPWRVYREQKQMADLRQSEMRGSEQVRTELIRRQAYARSSIGREEMARRNGYVKPGEVLLTP